MASREEIQRALPANRVVPLPVSNPHGPFGMDRLAETIDRFVARQTVKGEKIERSISLSIEVWEKLDNIARELTRQTSKLIRPSDVALSLVMQGIDSLQE